MSQPKKSEFISIPAICSIFFGSIAGLFNPYYYFFSAFGGLILVQTFFVGRLRKSYPFAVKDVMRGLVTEIPIGHSTEGFKTLVFSDSHPNFLVAGVPGSGKSVFLRQAITSLILKNKVKLHLIDLKRGVEFSMFKNCSCVESFAKSPDEARVVADKLETIMNKRYAIFERLGITGIKDYRKVMPRHICFIDEFAIFKPYKDLLEKFYKLFAQCRAVGIYFVVSTQRPDSSVLPGQLKALIDSVLCFRVMNRVNSQIVLDSDEASALPLIPGRAIYQTDRNIQVQVMYLPEGQAKELVAPFSRLQKARLNTRPLIDFSGIVRLP